MLFRVEKEPGHKIKGTLELSEIQTWREKQCEYDEIERRDQVQCMHAQYIEQDSRSTSRVLESILNTCWSLKPGIENTNTLLSKTSKHEWHNFGDFDTTLVTLTTHFINHFSAYKSSKPSRYIQMFWSSPCVLHGSRLSMTPGHVAHGSCVSPWHYLVHGSKPSIIISRHHFQKSCNGVCIYWMKYHFYLFGPMGWFCVIWLHFLCSFLFVKTSLYSSNPQSNFPLLKYSPKIVLII